MTNRKTGPTDCSVCAQPIRGTYHTNLWGRPFHTYHRACRSCLRPTAAQRQLCDTCRPTVITTRDVASSLVETIRQRLQEHRGIEVPAGLGVRLLDHLGRDNVLGQAQMHQTRHRDGRCTGTATIILKRGLPAIQLAAVAAHELSHVWLWAHDVDADTVTDEGVAELCAFWVLGRIGGSSASALQRRIATNPDPTYGDGYRRARAAEQRHGWNRVRTHLLTNGRLP